MIIKRAWYERSEGYPFLCLELEGFQPIAIIDSEAYRQLIGRRWEAVFLGAAFQELTSVHRQDHDWPGYTEDPRVVALAWQFIRDTGESGGFVEGKVLVGN